MGLCSFTYATNTEAGVWVKLFCGPCLLLEVPTIHTTILLIALTAVYRHVHMYCMIMFTTPVVNKNDSETERSTH